MNNAWRNFKGEKWQEEINVSSFIEENYTEYLGDGSFLSGASEKSKNVWNGRRSVRIFPLENR